MTNTSRFERWRPSRMIVAACLTSLTLAQAGAAYADAGSPASCIGHEASAISPPGSSDELPGGMPELKSYLDKAFPDVPHGVIVSTVAHLHEGSHEACDAATE